MIPVNDAITGDGFRALCDAVLDEREVRFDHSGIIRTVFVKTDLLPVFTARYLPRLTHPFILLTHNSAKGIDDSYQPLLDDRRLVRWYAQNTLIRSPKLKSLPLGIANVRWPHGDIAVLRHVAAIAPPADKWCYVNIRVPSSSGRRPVLEHFSHLPFATTVLSRKPFDEYLRDIAEHRFVISPPGKGVDCHRTWETLYLQRIPIVQRHIAVEQFSDLPILFVDDWHEVTKDLLSRVYQEMKSKTWNLRRLSLDYYRREWEAVLEEAYAKQCLDPNNTAIPSL